MIENKEKTIPTILVVDDNPVITKILVELLSRANYSVTAVDGGNKALASLNTLSIDLILLDIDMPEQSGLDVCRAIKANPSTNDIPVIFVTSLSDRENIVKGFEVGGQDYIVKPFIPTELMARVQVQLALRNVQKELRESMIRYRNLSIIDDLTGLFNTRYLYQTLQVQLEKQPKSPLSVIFIDIDKFKTVVDTYGHLNGSSTIAELAEMILPQLPKDCFGVSYGGDEFVLVLPNHDRIKGRKFAEQIRQSIEKATFLSFCDLNIHVTISSGIATYPDDAQSIEELLGNADHALFAAKDLGRNNVASFSEINKIAK